MTTREELIAAATLALERAPTVQTYSDIATAVVDTLIESGLLNDQRYEQVAYREREPSWDPYRKETMYHEADDVCGPAFPTLYEPVFRQVDVPGETL